MEGNWFSLLICKKQRAVLPDNGWDVTNYFLAGYSYLRLSGNLKDNNNKYLCFRFSFIFILKASFFFLPTAWWRVWSQYVYSKTSITADDIAVSISVSCRIGTRILTYGKSLFNSYCLFIWTSSVKSVSSRWPCIDVYNLHRHLVLFLAFGFSAGKDH